MRRGIVYSLIYSVYDCSYILMCFLLPLAFENYLPHHNLFTLQAKQRHSASMRRHWWEVIICILLNFLPSPIFSGDKYFPIMCHISQFIRTHIVFKSGKQKYSFQLFLSWRKEGEQRMSFRDVATKNCFQEEAKSMRTKIVFLSSIFVTSEATRHPAIWKVLTIQQET